MLRLRAPLGWIALLSAASALLYLHHLGSTPAYLSADEVSQSIHSLRFASTGRDEFGQRFPLNFPENGGALRDAMWIYVAAGVSKIAPFSEAAIRLPSACAGILNIVLIFLAAREMFRRTGPAVLAAGLLAVMPAHFIMSRIATSQIGTVTWTLGWLLFLARYLNGGARRDLAAATACLALGLYTYTAAFIIMPLYFLVTLVVIRVHHGGSGSRPAMAAALGGFLVTLAPLAVWHVVHPHQLGGLATFYSAREYNKDLGTQGFFGPQAISHLDAWWDCYNPDKLFFSGDGDLRYSTRYAGYFLLAAAFPMVVGIWTARRTLGVEMWLVLLGGLILAPLPSAVVSNSEIKRWLTFIPFGVLAIVCGIDRMAANRRRVVQAAALVVLVALAVQARGFLGDYFGRYRAASAPKFGGNLPGAIHEVLAMSGPQDCVVIDSGIDYLKDAWDLYTRGYRRDDLAARTDLMSGDRSPQLPQSCAGTSAIGRPGDARFAGWRSTAVHELDGTVNVSVYRRDAS
jgi:4-amino-4-deoxy-L-arabinose transferase-like glycosyltransferase